MEKGKKSSSGFSAKEIQQSFAEESRAKIKPGKAAAISYKRSRRNLSDALESGRLELFTQALDAMGFSEGTPQREQALQLFRRKHGLHSR